jgi:hypothetical protein
MTEYRFLALCLTPSTFLMSGAVLTDFYEVGYTDPTTALALAFLLAATALAFGLDRATRAKITES